jgi:hypothetical protein
LRADLGAARLRTNSGGEVDDLVGIEGVAVPEATDLDLITVCELARYEVSFYRDREMSTPIGHRVMWDHLEGQGADLVVSADRALLYPACYPMDDQPLEASGAWAFLRAVCGGRTRRRRAGLRRRGVGEGPLLREGSREVDAVRVSLIRLFGQRPRQDGVEVREIGSALRYPRWWRTQLVADDNGAI